MLTLSRQFPERPS